MEYSAIYHDAVKKYAFARGKDAVCIRIRVKKDDMEKIVLHYQDKYIPLEFEDTRQAAEMEKTACDGRCDYYEAVVQASVICLRYTFELTDTAGETCFYGNHEFSDVPIADIDRMFDFPQNLREEERFDVPAWAKNKIVYQIFPSRFAASEKVEEAAWYQAPIGARENLHGDLKGISDRLTHLHELGVDVLYLTPVFAANTMHKYDTVDYYRIDPAFGTESDLRRLVRQAHALGMKVVLDGVFNHTSPDFFAFRDVRQKEEKSAYKDWYYIEDFPLRHEKRQKPNFKSFAYFGGMPKLNLQNPETKAYIINVGRYWIRRCDIDGWRLDVGDEISHRFWKSFRSAIREVKPDALLVGEIWHCAEDFLEGDEWDSVMNYPFYFSVLDFVAKESITASRFYENLGYLRGNYHPDVYPLLWNLIDSHDTARFLHLCGEKKEKLKLAAALQLLLPGMPFIYYGDEYGMTGGPDPDCRRGMLWDEKYQDMDLYAWYRALIRIRKTHPCITQGRTCRVLTDDAAGLLVLEKSYEGEKLAIGFQAKERETTLAAYAGMENLIDGTAFSGTVRGYAAFVLRLP